MVSGRCRMQSPEDEVSVEEAEPHPSLHPWDSVTNIGTYEVNLTNMEASGSHIHPLPPLQQSSDAYCQGPNHTLHPTPTPLLVS